MPLTLPPLASLRLFEAAGRHLSFKIAAEELAVTPSAVSHAVRALEDWLGTPLFVRGARGLSLTAAGSQYLPAVREALTRIAVASDRVPGRRGGGTLSISVAPTLGVRLLLPRLHRFRSRHPEVAVDIDTTHRQVEFPRDGFDLAIRAGMGDWPGLAAVEILKEDLVPVASPELAERLGFEFGLCDAPLIHVTTVGQDWAAWAQATDSGPVDCRRGLMVDTVQMAIDAAVRGLGVAIGRHPLVDPELASGRLVRFGGPTVPSRSGYWLVGLPEAMKRPEIVAFRRWLVAEMRTVMAESAQGRAAPADRTAA